MAVINFCPRSRESINMTEAFELLKVRVHAMMGAASQIEDVLPTFKGDSYVACPTPV